MDTKRCSKCKIEKQFSEFRKCKSGTYGLQGYCKPCQANASKKYEANRKPRLEYNKAQWQKRKDDPHYFETRNKWKEKNKDLIKKKQKEYYLSHKNESNARRTNERAKKKNIDGRIEVSDWIMMLELSNYTCMACEKSADSDEQLSPDHVVSFFDGGLNYIGNIQPLCLYCQMKKGKRSLDFRTKEFNSKIRQNCIGQYMA